MGPIDIMILPTSYYWEDEGSENDRKKFKDIVKGCEATESQNRIEAAGLHNPDGLHVVK